MGYAQTQSDVDPLRRRVSSRSSASSRWRSSFGERFVPTAFTTLDSRGFVDEMLPQQGVQRRVALTVSHFLVAPHVIASSDLALVVSERVIEPYIKPLRLREMRLPLPLSRISS